jgi:hypothetical protein
MFRNALAARCSISAVFLASAALLSQRPIADKSSARLELPVIMRQKVTAGATRAGTKVQAKLAVATLVNGAVVPQGAILSGEVAESVAKSATSPSSLAIRLDSAHWKNRSRPVVLKFTREVYLTAWYYPAASLTVNNPPDQAVDASAPTPIRRSGSPPSSTRTYPSPNSPSQPFPGRDSNRNDDPAPPAPSSSISQHRVVMKDVESTRNNDGVVSLTSKRFNIKLDKTTTYVFAAGGLAGTG